MTPRELLLPRRKLIRKYPGCIVPVGTIFTFRSEYDTPHGFRMTLKQMDEFPDVFQEVEWWENRMTEDMPEYVLCAKRFEAGLMGRIGKLEADGAFDCVVRFPLRGSYTVCNIDWLLPATKEQYNECWPNASI